MLKEKNSLILIVIAISLLACSRPPWVETYTRAPSQLVLFQQAFINYAWGYQNRGWFVDRDGYVKAYRVSGNADSWNLAEKTGPDSGYIAQAALEENYALADRIIYQVPSKELAEKYSLIAQAAEGPYSPRTQTAFDAGAVYFIAYMPDQDRSMYRQVLLSLSGDFSRFNENPAAQELEKWLVGINQIYADSLARQK
jgi:hypothetical protein